MLVHSINVVEVKVGARFQAVADVRLAEYASKYQRSSECLGYTLLGVASGEMPRVLSGYWTGDTAMTEHYDHPELKALLEFLIGKGASLKFSIFRVVALI